MSKITIDMDALETLKESILSNYRKLWKFSTQRNEWMETSEEAINDVIAGLVSMNACAEMCSINKSIYGDDDESLTGSYCITPFINKEHHDEWMKEFYMEYFPCPEYCPKEFYEQYIL